MVEGGGWRERAGVGFRRLLIVQEETWNGCLQFKREGLTWRCELWSLQHINGPEILEVKYVYRENTSLKPELWDQKK